MPGPYMPPQPRRAQAVRSARGISRPRVGWWWLVPVVGLVPVLAAAVLAAQGVFSGSPRPTTTSVPVAGAPQPTVATVIAPAPPAPTVAAVPTAASATPPTVVAAAAAPTPAPVAPLAPVTTGTAAATATGSGGPFVAYRVQAGDTVRFIARTFGVSPASIANASGLSNPDLLRVGQVLTVPTQPGWLYRVQPGETLEQIAARTGVASETIASVSRLSVASVGPGTVILIPDQQAGQGK